MWSSVAAFFEGQSAMANFLEIAGAIVATMFIVVRALRWLLKRQTARRVTSIAKWLHGRRFGPVTAHSLRIAVVDDRPEDYPLDALRRLGYSVTHIPRLTLADVPSLRVYDCILLDINGVLDEDPKRGGLEVLKRLKGNSGPYVVAVSSKGFDITMSEFFMLADHRLKKPIPPADVEGIIERAFVSRYSAEHAAHRIDEAAALPTSKSRATRRALAAMRAYLESGERRDEAKRCMALVIPGERLNSALYDLDAIRRSLSRAP